jgi:hypothetical protein
VPGDIIHHRLWQKKTWWIRQNWESISGDYEDKVCESPLEGVFADSKDDLILYAQQLGKKCPKALAVAIATMAKESVATLFPAVAPPLHDGCNKSNGNQTPNAHLHPDAALNPPSTSGNKENVPPGSQVVNGDNNNTCGVVHGYVEPMYERQHSSYYWAHDKRRYYNLPCSKCKVSIGNVATVDDGSKQPLMIKPTAKTPVFVCKQFALGRSSCKHIICSKCWHDGHNTSTAGPSRRSIAGN